MSEPTTQSEPSLTDELRREFDAICERYPQRRAALLPIFNRIQEVHGYLAYRVLREIAEYIELSPADVLSTASFYTMYRFERPATHHVNLCRNISCWLRGYDDLREHVCRKLGVEIGGRTSDGRFALGEVECLGSCGTAPVMEIDGEYHERLTPQRMDEILDALD